MKNPRRSAYLIDLFISIHDLAWATRDRAERNTSCENALLALEAARIGMSVERLTRKYRVFTEQYVPF